MAHSFVKVTESQQSDSLLLVVAEDGTVTPDRATVESYLNNRSGATELQVMHVNKTDGQNIDVTLDTLMYVHSEEVVENEEIHPLTEDIFERDKLLRYISMDHDYFPLEDNQQDGIDDVEIVDELAQTLSLLEGTSEEIKPVKIIKATPTKPAKKVTPASTAKQKARMITTQQPPVQKQPKPTTPVVPKVIRQPPKPVIQIDDEESESDEDYDLEFEDDDNDSDFELEEAIKVKPHKKPKPRPARRTSESKTKVKKVAPKVEVEEKKVEKIEKEIIEVKPEVKPAEKKLVKKEKKVPKPPDDFALFSTPDIIRRVGGKEPTLPTTPTTPESPKKPGKILFETRSKSIDKKPAIVEKPRTSIDSTEKNRASIEKPKEIKKGPEKKPEGNVSVQGYDESLGSNSSESILEPQLEPMPSAEDIRAIIQNENTKSFTTSMVIPELVANDQNSLPLEAGGLDLDQAMLDNINTDILSEDILYQVAKSLADNPELQNVIDKSIVDGNLMLDPGIQQAMSEDQNMPHTNHLQPTIMSPMPEAANRGTQIIRADGRVVVLPPIERPTTRSRNRKDDNQSQETTPVPRLLKPLDDEHVSGNELDSSGDEQIEEDEEDPNKLWCICNQPHNGRFMICCDKCTEWYHGKCVGVSKSQGQLMEKQKKEWVCRFCKNKGRERPAAAAQRVRKASRASRTSSDSAGSQRKSTSSLTSEPGAAQQQPKAPACIVCGKTSRNSSIYCSDDCIRKHALGVDKVGVEKVGGYGERKTVRSLSGSGTPVSANLDRWLQDHPEGIRPVNKSSAGPKKMTQSKLQLVKNSSDEGVSLAVNKKGMHVGVLHHMPKGQQDATPKIVKKITGIKMLSKHSPMQKMTKLIQPVPIIKPQPSPTTPTTTTPVKTKPTPPAPKTPTPSPKEKPVVIKTPKSRQAEITIQQPKQENIRENVQKTLMEQLTNRLKMVNDLKLTEDEVTGISTEIENQLYKCFGETGQKYKNKYRSLIFNIKDVKNQTLWRRICEKSINPYQLVRLSPDDLASQELALWREREAKHQLDMIKKSELELLQCTRQYVFKTHKGEQVFEDDRPQDQTVSDVITGLNAEVAVEKEEVRKEPSKEKDRKTTSSASKHKRDRSRDRKSSKEKSDSKERRKDRRSGSRDKDRSRDKRRRSRSRDHSSRHSEKKRSRSRDRDRHRRSTHKSSRHKKEVTTDKLDKKSKEIWEQLVDKQIVPPLEDRLWKHVPQEDIVPAPNEESESDHEPTSTVTIPTPPRNSDDELPINPPPPDTVDKPEQKDVPRKVSVDSNEPLSPKDDTLSASPATEAIWTGTINMVDVAQIAITAHEVSGDCHGLSEELPGSLDIVGRISPETVWDYIGKMKCSNSKMISLLKLKATNMEEKMPYIALYSYLSSRNRLGVVKSTNKAVKDFYILPLDGATPLPQALLPINGPGFEENRSALLIGIIVRDKRKRPILDSITNAVVSKKARVEVTASPPPAVATSGSSTPPQPPSTTRSYTPPPNRDPRIKAPPVTVAPPAATPPAASTADEDEPYSPEDSDPDATTPPLPMSDSSRLSTNLMSNVTKNSSFLNTGLPTQAFKPFNNKFDDIPGLGLEVQSVLPNNSSELQRKMAELDQRIAMQQAEIHNMSQDIVSSASGSDIGTTALANIALPNNLQQILESIKIIGAARTDTDPPAGNSLNSSQSDLTIPLMLPKISSRPLTGAAARADGLSPTIPLNLPKLKSKHSATNSPQRVPQDSDKQSQSSVLSSLSEEDLIRKAAEMLGESEATPPPTKKSRWVEPEKEVATPYSVPPPNLFSQPPPPINPPLPTSPNAKRSKIDFSQPPIPGLED